MRLLADDDDDDESEEMSSEDDYPYSSRRHLYAFGYSDDEEEDYTGLPGESSGWGGFGACYHCGMLSLSFVRSVLSDLC